MCTGLSMGCSLLMQRCTAGVDRQTRGVATAEKGMGSFWKKVTPKRRRPERRATLVGYPSKGSESHLSCAKRAGYSRTAQGNIF